MALINCPECGGQVSDRAPVCPHCGFPLAAADPSAAPPVASVAGGAPQPVAMAAAPAGLVDDRPTEAADPDPTPPIEPFAFRLAGRRIPVAMLLFFGGMTVGTVLKFAMPAAEGAEPESWRILPWAMIWLGVLWFAVTEFTALLRNRLRRRH